MNLVFTDVDTPQVHCQRHIYVYPFVYHQNYTSTQLQSPAINRGRGGAFVTFSCFWFCWGTLEVDLKYFIQICIKAVDLIF